MGGVLFAEATELVHLHPFSQLLFILMNARGNFLTHSALEFHPFFFSPFCHSGYSKYQQRNIVEPMVGFEPTTYGLQNRCSTS